MSLPSLTIVFGGVSSGKSAYGEQIVNASGRPKVYIATARVFDDEMRNKVADHVKDRGEGWRTIEAPLDLVTALNGRKSDEAVLLDCATMWLTNMMMDELDVEDATTGLLAALRDCPCPVVVVSNELGLGGVSDNALARRFARLQGRLNARLAAQAETAVLVIAGLPQVLKGKLA